MADLIFRSIFITQEMLFSNGYKWLFKFLIIRGKQKKMYRTTIFDTFDYFVPFKICRKLQISSLLSFSRILKKRHWKYIISCLIKMELKNKISQDDYMEKKFFSGFRLCELFVIELHYTESCVFTFCDWPSDNHVS